METLLRDTRHALRRLRRTPAFTAAVILTLALGIGANTAIFGVIDSILIRPLAVSARGGPGRRLAHGAGSARLPGQHRLFSVHVLHLSRRERTFEQFGVWRSGGASVTGTAEPELLRALFVTYGVLDAVGVKPLLGRWFSPADDTPGSPETVILTYGYWQRRFGGDTVHPRACDDDRVEAAHGDRRHAGGIPLSARSRADSSSAVRTQHGESGHLRLSGHCAAQARRHDGAGQRRCGSHVGSLVERLASAAGNRSRGISGRSLRTRDSSR